MTAGRRELTRRAALGHAAAGLALAVGCERKVDEPLPAPVDDFDPDAETKLKLLARQHPPQLLERAAARARARKTTDLVPAAIYNTVVVYDTDDLEGGGTTFGQDFLRGLLELGVGKCEHVFEFCSGPAYIGYSLLANGFCQKLTLGDINPAAIAAVRHTAAQNKLEHLITAHVSDGLSQIPASERWDLVVSNPPHFIIDKAQKDRRLIDQDPAWSVHAEFYARVKAFMKPGGKVVFVENGDGSRPEDFEPMIRAGGGSVVATRPIVLLNGKKTAFYYQMSSWSSG